MMSVIAQPAHIPLHVENHQPKDVELNELGNLQDALEPFAQLIRRSGRSVRLHCTIPTVCSSSNACKDLHDLHDLRSRSLVFVHNLVESLRASGVSRFVNAVLCLLNGGLDWMVGSGILSTTAFQLPALSRLRFAARA
ncbi:hypothetical protein AcW2_000883 [Taiwanofungus camphoratus]|nr:hypothetical protein AcW2_000883 [Antrodia cinnamomea]